MEALRQQGNVFDEVVSLTDIKSSLGPFRVSHDYVTVYSEVVIEALGNLYGEYNETFTPLVEANREWDTDYQYCLDKTPINWCVQIDMVGLSDGFLQEVYSMPEEKVRTILRSKIFEIENSIAAYQLLERFFSRNGNGSFFKARFRVLLASIRQKFGKPIALLAVTDEKYEAMLASEFGKVVAEEEELDNKEVMELSGFDTFFGPEQFSRYLRDNDGQCGYLLYVRSSDPIEKLKRPDTIVEHPLLSDADVRRVIKANALTFNIDAPEMDHARKINDTKDYMPPMGMAFPISSKDDLYSTGFQNYLVAQGVNMKLEEVRLRCKPAKGTYGCYGHISGSLKQERFRNELEKNILLRGPYVVQLEMEVPVIADSRGEKYVFIDRDFFGIIDGKPYFIGGVRNLMPAESEDAKKGRIHGSRSAVYAEIIC